MSPSEWAMLIALSVLWGGPFFFVVIALRDLPPVATALLRVGIAALALNLLLRAIGMKIPANLALWRDFLVMGLLNLAIPFALIAWGQTRIDSGLASIFNATTPFSTAIAAHILTQDERLRPNGLAGVSEEKLRSRYPFPAGPVESSAFRFGQPYRVPFPPLASAAAPQPDFAASSGTPPSQSQVLAILICSDNRLRATASECTRHPAQTKTLTAMG